VDPTKTRAYGGIVKPTLPGSAGGNNGGAGGGVVYLNVSSFLHLNGTIVANGASCTSSGCGGGSGTFL
jgi:hypothetical protein